MACLYGGTSKAEQFPGWKGIFELFQGCLEDPSNIWLDSQPASTIYLADLVRAFEIYVKSVSQSCLFPAFVLKRADCRHCRWPFVGDGVTPILTEKLPMALVEKFAAWTSLQEGFDIFQLDSTGWGDCLSGSKLWSLASINWSLAKMVSAKAKRLRRLKIPENEWLESENSHKQFRKENHLKKKTAFWGFRMWSFQGVTKMIPLYFANCHSRICTPGRLNDLVKKPDKFTGQAVSFPRKGWRWASTV